MKEISTAVSSWKPTVHNELLNHATKENNYKLWLQYLQNANTEVNDV